MAKNELKTIWYDLKKSPALLISILVGIGIVLFIVYKNSTANNTSSTASPDSGTPYYVAYVDDDKSPQQKTPNPPIFKHNPGPPGGGNTSARVRTKTATGYDTTHSGVPWYKKISPNSDVHAGYIPFSASVDILSQNLVEGPPQPNGDRKYYQVKYNNMQGYVVSSDIYIGP